MDLINDHGLETIRKSAELVPDALPFNYQIRNRSYITNSAGTQTLKFDKTNALATIDYAHYEVHNGNHFYICNYDTKNVNQTIIFALTTPNTTKWAHLTFAIQSTDKKTFQIHEGATVTGGTAVIPFNNNRNSSTVSTIVVAKDPTISIAGTLIYAAASGERDASGLVLRENELILKQNTTYTFTITSLINANVISYCGEWYEDTFKV